MRFFLIGFMGSGKSTLGKRLATKLGFPFIDMDKQIESAINMSIPEYFKKHGEAAFREIESSVLKTSNFPENAIIATGGGAPCFFDNIDWMNKNGVTVYLSLSPKALAQRLVNATEERPVLKNLKGPELEQFITEKLKAREGFYKKAKISINGIDQTPEKLSAILRQEHYLK